MSIRVTSRPGHPLVKTGPRNKYMVAAAVRAARAEAARDLALDASGDAIDTFAAALGGRQRLIDTLALGDTEGELAKVLADLADPVCHDLTLREVCARSGVSVAALFAAHKRASFTRAHLEATERITKHLVAVVEDVMRRALPLAEPCPRCQGAPTTPDTIPCTVCEGRGTLLIEPSLDRQKLALELGHLIERRAGGSVVMQQNTIATGGTIAAPTAPGNLEQLQQVVGDLLFTPGRRRTLSPPIDIAPAPPAEESPAP